MSTTARLTLETVETGLRFRIDAGSGQRAWMDSGPGMQSPNPIEAFVASLGACHAMDIISILRKKRQQVTGYEVDMVAERRADHPRAVTRVHIVHRLRGRDLQPAAIEEAMRLSAEKYCSVHASISKDILIESRYEIEAV